MNYLLPNPVSIDWYVENMKAVLYDRICRTWGVDDSSYNCFGRCYRRKTGDGWQFNFYNPATENYVSGLGDNSGQMFFEDTKAVVSMFVMQDPVKYSTGGDKAKMQLIFFVDLAKITPGGLNTQQQGGQRLDDIAINDVESLIKFGAGFSFIVTGQERGIENVLKGYAGKNKNQMMILSTDTMLAFAIDLNLTYNPLLNAVYGQIPAIMPQLIPQSLKLYIVDSPDPNSKIQVGINKWVQKEYAPCDILSVQAAGDSNSFLAGRKVNYPFIYDNGNIQESEGEDQYNEVTGLWDRTGAGDGPFGFNSGDKVIITALVQQF